MAGTDDDHSTDDWQRFCLLRDAHSYFLELTGLEEHAKKLVVNFLRGGEYDPTGRKDAYLQRTWYPLSRIER